jgi:flagellar biosynthesis repressor protein FlbT
MSGGLVIRLRPHEKFLINGAVVENGERRAKLRVKSRDANILRLRDAMHPNDVTTPVRRLYYTAQLAVTGDLEPNATVAELLPGLKALLEALPDEQIRIHLQEAVSHTQAFEFYYVMRALKKILPYEEKLLLIAKAKELTLIGEKAQ